MKLKTITILLLTIPFFVKSQNIKSFYKQINKASNLAKTGKKDSAIIEYEEAFMKIDYVNTVYLKRALKLSKYIKDKKRIKDYKTKIKKQRKGTNDELGRVIDSLIKLDIKLRNNFIYKKQKFLRECLSDSTYDRDNKKFIKAYKLQNKIDETDSSNVAYLLKLFEKHGFIGEELVGRRKRRNIAVIVMLLHFDTDTNSQILKPILQKALYEGKLSPYYYSTIIDRHLFYSSAKEQVYWTWPYGGKVKYTIDKEAVFKRREEIFMYDSDVWFEKKGKYWFLRNKYNF